MPNLLAFAEEYRIPMTFYCNMGRAVSYVALARKRFRNAGGHEKAILAKLSPKAKMGNRDYLRTSLLNPVVGSAHGAILQEAARHGHELGLHGGRNHGSWHHEAHLWTEERVRTEVAWGLERFDAMGLEKPVGFASPGWNSPEGLGRILGGLGFGYMADDYGQGDFCETKATIRCVRTQLTGEGGVGFFESLAARGLDSGTGEQAMKGAFESAAACDKSVCVYDHPCFAGREGLGMLKGFVEHLKRRPVRFATVRGAMGTDA